MASPLCSHRFIARLIMAATVAAGASCMATPTTFVLAQAQRRSGFDTYQLAFTPIADDPALDPGLRESFENGFVAGLESAGGFRALGTAQPTAQTLVLHYRAAGVSEGSLAARAGTAAVNAFLPVGVIPEVGGGDLGVETTFFDAAGAQAGRILVQANVRGLLSTDAGTMRRIGSATGEYLSNRFAIRSSSEESEPGTAGPISHEVVNLTPQRAKAALAILEPLVGDWNMEFEIQVSGRAPIKARVRETFRWEAGGRMLFQFAETLDTPEPLFRCAAITWDPVAHALSIFSMDSVFGTHESYDYSCERSGQTLRATAREKDQVMESVDVFSEDGTSRQQTKRVWSADRSRLLLSVKSAGTKQRR